MVSSDSVLSISWIVYNNLIFLPVYFSRIYSDSRDDNTFLLHVALRNIFGNLMYIKSFSSTQLLIQSRIITDFISHTLNYKLTKDCQADLNTEEFRLYKKPHFIMAGFEFVHIISIFIMSCIDSKNLMPWTIELGLMIGIFIRERKVLFNALIDRNNENIRKKLDTMVYDSKV
jgi:hypothetical protein